MQITLYSSFLCPRCYLARKWLERSVAANSGMQIEVVDILASPGRAWKDGIRMIPAVKAGCKQLSGIFLSERDIAAFVAKLAQADKCSTR